MYLLIYVIFSYLLYLCSCLEIYSFIEFPCTFSLPYYLCLIYDLPKFSRHQQTFCTTYLPQLVGALFKSPRFDMINGSSSHASYFKPSGSSSSIRYQLFYWELRSRYWYVWCLSTIVCVTLPAVWHLSRHTFGLLKQACPGIMSYILLFLWWPQGYAGIHMKYLVDHLKGYPYFGIYPYFKQVFDRC